MKILLVEDDKRLAIHIQTYLEKDNHKVLWVNNGNKAIRTLEKDTYDGVISDIQMPGGDGIELLQGAWRELDTPPPFCVHSSENTFWFYDRTWDLPVEIPKYFEFAEFHNKQTKKWEEYIPKFLKSIQK